jgi:hypothetical protein
VLLVLGLLIDLVGTIWLLQGLNLLDGSAMTGQPFWAIAGGVLIVIGTLSVVVSRRIS